MQAAVDIFKALCDKTRLRILALLTNGELCVCDITAVLGMPQSTVSRHLARLRAAGLVTARRNNVWMHYSLAEPNDELTRAINLMVYGSVIETKEARADARKLQEHLTDKRISGVDACA